MRIDDGRVSFIQKVQPGDGGKTLPLSRLRHLALRTDYWRSPGHRKVDRYANGRGGLKRHRSVRTEQDGKAITATNPRWIRPVLLDVTNGEHISALANSLPTQLNAIVNNAGIAVSGPVEAVLPTEVRRQFVLRALLPN